MNNKLNNPNSLEKSHTTLDFYEREYESFWKSTKDHDVSQNYNSFFEAINQNGPLKILDLGCGPGRDLIYFKSLGHKATGLDGCKKFCEMAKNNSGCEVLNQNFLELDLPENHFDGIFANASLLHVPKEEFQYVLKSLNKALKTNGVLFSSNIRGKGERYSGEKYLQMTDIDEYKKLLNQSGFSYLSHYFRPINLPIKDRQWLACLSKKN